MQCNEILRSLRTSGDYSDLSIVCGDREFKVHKNVMCLRSKWFKAACHEGRWMEGKEGSIALKAIDKGDEEEDYSCDDPEAVSLMIDYIYLNDYTSSFSDDTRSSFSAMVKRLALSASDGLPPHQVPVAEPNDMFGGSQLADDLWGAVSAKKKKKKEKKASAIWDPPFEDSEDTFRPSTSQQLQHGAVSSSLPPGGNALTMHARLYAMGSKYDIHLLRELTIEKFTKAIQGT